MDEYISRQGLLDNISESVVFSVKDGATSAEIRGANKILDRIKWMPAADVVEVVHGRWESGKCTVCAFDLRGLTDGENDLEQWVWDEGFPHCPHCGARMDGELYAAD